ncbi:glutathione binding-like protein [Croceicoccus naphthovorans]|uniref:Uncharacterized protein n=1 Tax=Croceicoccus naphthovorans TaxID=1348774 RepID=A0A0G3XJG6_9SPHN|nr:glutathione binding-like protein [Croceicoccus naphthovorans]AKM10739.1 hypothetical protein AB433_13420 [Croceicoccus naphthovorans]MBB3992214.1 glutathione S-transferase [Croceicoccus naphthovorans]
MEYLTVAEARERTGLRLVLSAHVPGPWGESAKYIFAMRGVDYQPVAQEVFGANDALHSWTGHRNAPIAMLDKEPPISGWLDLLMLAERLGQGPSLLPQKSEDRALALGLSAEVCAPYGLGWERRLLMLGDRFGMSDPPSDTPALLLAICRRYGYTATAAAVAAERVADILRTLALKLEASGNSPYLVGDRLSVVDIYWACFSNMLAPLSHDVSPMPDGVREAWQAIPPVVIAALAPALLRHRDFIYERHIGLPLDY